MLPLIAVVSMKVIDNSSFDLPFFLFGSASTHSIPFSMHLLQGLSSSQPCFRFLQLKHALCTLEPLRFCNGEEEGEEVGDGVADMCF